MATQALNSNLNNLPAINSIGSWADAVDQETLTRTEITKDGVKTVVDIVDDKDAGGKCKVITTYKVITKRVPRQVAERKKWEKFGASENDGAGPNVATTYVAEEVTMQFIRNQAGETVQEMVEEKKQDKGYATKGHCRFCKSDEHWSVACPYKEMYATAEDEENLEDNKLPPGGKTMGTVAGSRYIPPSQRGDRLLGVGERRSDDYTVRVTNLPEDEENLDEELRRLFGSIGRIERFFLARDKVTNRPKGFAFITYTNREDAERAMNELRGYRMHHLVLKVEWTRPSS
uniref:Eukaryotic translation initiation factor 3 subunit G n=1 Tax=Acrobeloides nanus TaxID=290746 RepID=A0A914DYH7_9BILA